MQSTGFRQESYGEYEAYLSLLGEDNSEEHSRLLRNLGAAMRDELTERQREMLSMYYIDGLNMPQIASELGVNTSTVSRTIGRGLRRLRRCLRYGARELLTAGRE